MIVQAASNLSMSPLAFVIIAALGLLASLMIMLDLRVSLVCSIVGFLLPAHKTYQILEQKADMEAHRACLTYWLVFAMFMLVEGLLDSFFFWIPLYYFIRVAFQAWLFYKNFAGAELLFKYAAQPAMARFDEVFRLITKDSITHNVPESKRA